MIYVLTIINGILFDTLVHCPLGVLFLIALIGLLNEECSSLLYRFIARVFFPAMNIATAYEIIHEYRSIVNFLVLIFVILTCLVEYTCNFL
jgi:hypothetical protein